MTDDVDADVRAVVAQAARWDGGATPLALAAAARGVERLFDGLADDERAAAQAVHGALALARLAMRSAEGVTASLLDAPLDAAVRALVASGWPSSEARRQIHFWLVEALLQDCGSHRCSW